MMKNPLLLSLVLIVPSYGAVTLSDNFESGAVSTDWGRRSNVTVNDGGPGASTKYAAINATSNTADGLGDQIGGANNFTIDFYFRVKSDATNRQFNIGVSTASVNPSPGDAAINLRYQGGDSGTFALYNTMWNNIALGSVTAGQWYHMQIEGIGWGAAGATYSLRLSDAGGDTFTRVLTGLTTVQNGSISGSFSYGTPATNFSGTAQSFIFSTVYGANPGFDIDNVVVNANIVPEPSSLLLLGSVSFVFSARRRRG